MQINIELNTNDVSKAIKQLEKIKKAMPIIIQNFCIASMNWIIKRANQNLDKSTWGYMTSDIRESWHWELLDNTEIGQTWRLYNDSDVAMYAEFGTGLIGKISPHPLAQNQPQQNYEYDVNNHGSKGWHFWNEEQGLEIFSFTGYKGKAFLYNAFWDYFYKDQQYKILWRQAFNEYINGGNL